MKRLLPALLTLLVLPASAWAGAEGPGTPQATAANATFLSNAPIPPTGRGVCVIDTGVDTDTDLGPALAGRISQIGGVPGDPTDFGTIDAAGESLPKHGTYVSGVIASQVDGVGTSGIWPAAKIYSNRVFAGGGTAAVNDYGRAINWCRDQPGVKVINLSLSGLSTATTSERANLNNKIIEVRGAPYFVNVVAAAGNNGSGSTVGYPAVADGVFAVGATDAAGALAPFSNRGIGLDIAAFGVDACLTTSHGTHLASGSGTSYAAPVVSAVLAALRSYDAALTPDQAEALLLANADSVAGVKVLNAARAFRADPALVAMTAGVVASGLDSAVTNRCEAPPAPPASAEGGSGAGQTATQSAGPAPVFEASPSEVPAPAIDLTLPAAAPAAPSMLRAPELGSVSHRRGVLTVRLVGFQPGDRASYRVSYRTKDKVATATFVRRSATLRIRIPNWTAVRVRLERLGTRPSPVLVVRPNIEF